MTKAKIILSVLFFIRAICVISVSAQKYVSPDAVKTTIINAAELKALVKSPEKKQPITFRVSWN